MTMRSSAGAVAQRGEQMGEAERVDGDRLDGIGDGAAHQRLGGVVQHDLGVGGGDRGGDRVRGAQIAEARIEILRRRRRAKTATGRCRAAARSRSCARRAS